MYILPDSCPKLGPGGEEQGPKRAQEEPLLLHDLLSQVPPYTTVVTHILLMLLIYVAYIHIRTHISIYICVLIYLYYPSHTTVVTHICSVYTYAYSYIYTCIRIHTCVYSLIPAPSLVLERRNKDPSEPKKNLSTFMIFSNEYNPSPTYTTVVPESFADI